MVSRHRRGDLTVRPRLNDRLAHLAVALLASTRPLVASAAEQPQDPVTAAHPRAPAALPAGYDPARLGAELLAGESWQGLVAAGTPDQGWANVTRNGKFSIGSSAIPSSPSVLGIFPDPHGTFGQVLRYRTPAGTSVTIEDHRTFKPSARVWARSTFLFRGTDPAGFTAKTRTPGESGTLKLVFLFPEGNKTRMDWVLTSSGFLAHGCPRHGNPAAVQVPMTSSGAGVPPPEPAGPFRGVYVTSKPAGVAAHDLLRNGDWYEFVLNYETTGPTSYLHRWFLRRLTVNGAWAPWPTPVWVGCATTNGTPMRYHEIWRTGNKSGAADAEQFLFLGPWEVTSAPDPYGWDRYGKDKTRDGP